MAVKIVVIVVNSTCSSYKNITYELHHRKMFAKGKYIILHRCMIYLSAKQLSPRLNADWLFKKNFVRPLLLTEMSTDFPFSQITTKSNSGFDRSVEDFKKTHIKCMHNWKM